MTQLAPVPLVVRQRPPLAIGICGPEGAGKSTTARVLAKSLGLEPAPFAGPLKRMLASLGVPQENLTGSQEQKSQPLELLGGISARHAMQTLGTEWGRLCMHQDFWVQIWERENAQGRVIADDLRFQNEMRAICNLDGVVLKIIGKQEDYKRIPGHASEDFARIPAHYTIVSQGGDANVIARAVEDFIDLIPHFTGRATKLKGVNGSTALHSERGNG